MTKDEREVIALGEVVCCYRGTPSEVHGVVVHQPRDLESTEHDSSNCYRVRISTETFDAYVELGVFRKDLERDPKREWRWTGSDWARDEQKERA